MESLSVFFLDAGRDTAVVVVEASSATAIFGLQAVAGNRNVAAKRLLELRRRAVAHQQRGVRHIRAELDRIMQRGRPEGIRTNLQ